MSCYRVPAIGPHILTSVLAAVGRPRIVRPAVGSVRVGSRMSCQPTAEQADLVSNAVRTQRFAWDPIRGFDRRAAAAVRCVRAGRKRFRKRANTNGPRGALPRGPYVTPDGGAREPGSGTYQP